MVFSYSSFAAEQLDPSSVRVSHGPSRPRPRSASHGSSRNFSATEGRRNARPASANSSHHRMQEDRSLSAVASVDVRTDATFCMWEVGGPLVVSAMNGAREHSKELCQVYGGSNKPKIRPSSALVFGRRSKQQGPDRDEFRERRSDFSQTEQVASWTTMKQLWDGGDRTLRRSATSESLGLRRPAEWSHQRPSSASRTRGSSQRPKVRASAAAPAELCRDSSELQRIEATLMRNNLPKADMMAMYLRKNNLGDDCRMFAFDGPDEHIRQALLQRTPPCIENPVGGSVLWEFKWCVTDVESDYPSLQEGDLYNHFQNNRALTTKSGLATSLRRLCVDEHVDIDAFFPRCYDLGSASERDDLVLDFRRSAALNVVTQHTHLQQARVAQESRLDGYLCNANVLRVALRALTHWLDELNGTVLDETSPGCKVQKTAPIHAQDWDALVLYAQCSLDQLCNQKEVPTLARGRHRGFSISGNPAERSATGTVAGGKPPPDIRRWPEFGGHVWLPELPKAWEDAAEAAVVDLDARWPQMSAQGPRNVWIVKPRASSKGSGVSCTHSLPEVLHQCKTSIDRIVQKYIERPLLLFSGRKFDIRQWVLVESFDPLRACMFSTCYLRLCNEAYDLEDLDNKQRHISNWAVNRQGQHVAEGGVASLGELRAALSEITGQNMYWEDVLVPKLKDIIVHSLKAAQPSIVQRSQCFEMYGFDFLISEDLRPWLLEVNLSPACEARTAWLSSILERMATRMMDLLLDGASGPDGCEPDWVRIVDEPPPLPDIHTRSSPLECAAGAEPMPGALELVVVGKPLDVRAEKRFEEAWRRRRAQSILARAFRRHLSRSSWELCRRSAAACVVQRRVLAFLAHKAFERHGLRRHVLAGWRISRWWRCIYTHRVACIRRIQASFRGVRARREFKYLQHHVLRPTRKLSLLFAVVRWRWQAARCVADSASRTLQKVWRELVARMILHGMIRFVHEQCAAATIKAVCRIHCARAEVFIILRVSTATRVQVAWRRLHARRSAQLVSSEVKCVVRSGGTGHVAVHSEGASSPLGLGKQASSSFELDVSVRALHRDSLALCDALNPQSQSTRFAGGSASIGRRADVGTVRRHDSPQLDFSFSRALMSFAQTTWVATPRHDIQGNSLVARPRTAGAAPAACQCLTKAGSRGVSDHVCRSISSECSRARGLGYAGGIAGAPSKAHELNMESVRSRNTAVDEPRRGMEEGVRGGRIVGSGGYAANKLAAALAVGHSSGGYAGRLLDLALPCALLPSSGHHVQHTALLKHNSCSAAAGSDKVDQPGGQHLVSPSHSRGSALSAARQLRSTSSRGTRPISKERGFSAGRARTSSARTRQVGASTTVFFPGAG
mmetsp:Transcript_27054/g.89843  ORF Transcript_27054/g.89843 Transcript_27054/m.89843 type:complete len:1358 (+) Transcript_27054:153-4226(+)